MGGKNKQQAIKSPSSYFKTVFSLLPKGYLTYFSTSFKKKNQM